ncbi:MAG: hypothetical protein NVS3B26_01910 [Mycobacteriales bacterium]
MHGTLTGFGLDGPDAARPGFDISAFFGRGGITHHRTGSRRPEPGRRRAITQRHWRCLPPYSSLRLVDRTGGGQVVDVNLLATTAWTMSSDLSSTLVDGQDPPVLGRRRHALHESFRTADDRWILLFMPEPHWWARFCATVEKPEWIDDPRLATLTGREEHMGQVTDLMDELFATRALAQWGVLFDEAGLTWGPAATVSELAVDPHAAAVGMFPVVQHPVAGSFRTVAAPMRLRGQEVSSRRPAPELGQHTREVLAERGLSSAEVEALVADGTVATG